MSIARIRALTAGDWWVLARCAVIVLAARVALWTTSVRGARFVVKNVARTMGRCDAGRATWAVAAVSRRIPGASCLTQALALQALLRHAGRVCRIEIGVAKEEGFEAHAWVVCGQEIVLGGQHPGKFQTVATLE